MSLLAPSPGSRPAPAPESSSGQALVLLVDDEAPLLALGHAWLTRWGYGVWACATSADALARFTAAPDAVALLVADYSMPTLTGGQLAAACWALRPALPVLLVTGWLDLPDAMLAPPLDRGPEPALDSIQGQAPGSLAVLRKPYSGAAFAAAVRGLLGSGEEGGKDVHGEA